MSSTTTVTRTKTSIPVKRFPSSTPSKIRTRAQRRLNPSPVKRQQPPPPTTPKTPLAVLQPSNRLPFVPFTFTPHREVISMPPKPLAKRKNTKAQKTVDNPQTTLTLNPPAAVRKRPSSPSLVANEGPSPKRLRTESIDSAPVADGSTLSQAITVDPLSAPTISEVSSEKSGGVPHSIQPNTAEAGQPNLANGTDATLPNPMPNVMLIDLPTRPKSPSTLYPPSGSHPPLSNKPLSTPVSRLPHFDQLKAAPSPWRSVGTKVPSSAVRNPVNTSARKDKLTRGPIPSKLKFEEAPTRPKGVSASESTELSSSCVPLTGVVPPTSLVTPVTKPPPTPASRLPRPKVHAATAFELPLNLSPIKPFAGEAGPSTSKEPSASARPSILQRAGTVSGAPFRIPTLGPSTTTPVSGTIAALMKRNTVDPHKDTRHQLSTLSDALDRLSVPRPSSAMASFRPATSMGLRTNSSTRDGTVPRGGTVNSKKSTTSNGLALQRPGTSIGMSSKSRPNTGMQPPSAFNGSRVSRNKTQVGKHGPANPNMGPPPPPAPNPAANAARRASLASMALSQSLPPSGAVRTPQPYTTASGRRVMSVTAKGAQLPTTAPTVLSSSSSSLNEGAAPTAMDQVVSTPEENKSPAMNPREVLKDCTIFVDVRTDDGDDAGGLFVEMLKGLGARLLTRPGKTLTHIVYKSGMQSTLTHYRALPNPKPVVVGIGWVVECVEKRARVETGKFEMSLEEVAGSVSGLKDTKARRQTQAQVQTKLQFKPADKMYSGDVPSATEAGGVGVELGSLNAGSHAEDTT